MSRRSLLPICGILFLASAARAQNTLNPGPPQQYYLGDFFAPGAQWQSGDTRYSGYVSEHGSDQLVAGDSTTANDGADFTVYEDDLIVARVSLVSGKSDVVGPDNPAATGALSFICVMNGDKATLENRSYFTAPLGDLSNITFTYDWYRQSGGVAAPALKLGIDTSEANPVDIAPSLVEADRGETRFDKILVYSPICKAAARSTTAGPPSRSPRTRGSSGW